MQLNIKGIPIQVADDQVANEVPAPHNAVQVLILTLWRVS